MDYIEVDKVNPLNSHSVIKDWSGMSSPQYCCETLIGTNLAATEIEMKNNYKNCCESDLYFATNNINIRRAATFVPAGTVIEYYNQENVCPSGLIGLTCFKNGARYQTTQNRCCDITTGLASDGTEDKICCDYASAKGNLSKFWDGTSCVACKSCSKQPKPPEPDPTCMEDPNHCFYVWEETIDPDPYTVPYEETICKAPCIKIGNTCCQAQQGSSTEGNGYDHDGVWTGACCPPNLCGEELNQSCFRGYKIPKKIASAHCLELVQTDIPVDPPPYTTMHRDCVHPCPAGYPPLSEIPK